MSELNGGESFHLDTVLGRLGTFGRHQVVTMGMLALVYATNSMYNVNYVFAVEDVGYRCHIPSCDNGSTPYLSPWLAASPPREPRYHPPADAACSSFLNTTLPCDRWVYEVPHSFVAEFNLAGQEWKLALVGTAHCFGNMLGQLVQGQISDRWGRKTAAVLAGTAGAVLGLAKSFLSSFWLYVALEALEAAAGDALSPIFMLSIEIIEKKRTVLFQMILLNFYTLGQIVLPLVAWGVPYWRHLLRALYAPSLLVATYCVLLDESVRWLYSKGRRERALALILKIAKRNNVVVDRAELDKLDYIQETGPKTKVSDTKLILGTFKSPIMMRRFLVCLVWWFSITLINYGMMIGSVFIDGNKYINFALLMMMDIPANVFYWLALSKYKRKLPLLASFLVGGVFCISQPFVPKEWAWVGVALYMSFEMLATFSYNIVYMYTSELFPTHSRNSVHAACAALGRLGALLAPQAPLLMSIWSGLPTFIFGVLSLVSGALTLLTPETAREELPDTLAAAESIGRAPRERGKQAGLMPCTRERSKEAGLMPCTRERSKEAGLMPCTRERSKEAGLMTDCD